MKLLEEKAKRDVEEKGKPNIAKSESLQTKLELKSTRPLTLPPLFAPFKDEKKGWTKSNVAKQVTLYINLLGYGIGGDKTFVGWLMRTVSLCPSLGIGSPPQMSPPAMLQILTSLPLR